MCRSWRSMVALSCRPRGFDLFPASYQSALANLIAPTNATQNYAKADDKADQIVEDRAGISVGDE